MGTNICIYVYMYMCICIVLLGTNIPNFEVTCPGHLTLKCTGQAMTYHSKVPSQQEGITKATQQRRERPTSTAKKQLDEELHAICPAIGELHIDDSEKREQQEEAQIFSMSAAEHQKRVRNNTEQ